MKKTKTGLHIQTRKNRIEVLTEKELQQQELKKAEQRQLVVMASILFLAFLTFCFCVFGYVIQSLFFSLLLYVINYTSYI